ncbi:MAG: hypothetical protein WC205_10770 [Opitutaceae bacterium]
MKTSMKNLLLCAGLGVSLFAGPLLADTLPNSEASLWFRSNYWAYTPAKGVDGTVEPVSIDGKSVLRLRYVFTPEGGRYSAAYLYLKSIDQFTELRFRVKSDMAGNVLVRLFDADGEALQYVVPVKKSAEWTDIRIEVARPTTTFATKAGVILNKKADFPATGVFFGLEVPKGTEASGDILYTEPELVR